jgi:Uma2 family endonuclease
MRATLSHVPLPLILVAEQLMGMPAVESHRWTADEVRALPEEPGKRYECVDGELLVSPGPRIPHQYAVGFLHVTLHEYCRATGIGVVLMGPGELELDTFTLVQPDVFVVPLHEGKRPMSQEEIGNARLIVEVLSPSTARFDRILKRQRYQRQGVELWIVDLDARLVERWMPDDSRPEILTDTVVWHPSGAAQPLVIALAELFAEALGET